MWKGTIQKNNQESSLCNSVWQWGMKYSSSLSINDHKSKAHIELQLWAFGYGFNFGSSSKKTSNLTQKLDVVFQQTRIEVKHVDEPRAS